MEEIQIDNLAPNEAKVVGLKHTFPDPYERERKLDELINAEVDVVAEPSNNNDQLALRCFVDGIHLGYIACELCHLFYPYLDDRGHARARIVRRGRRTCLIVKFMGKRNHNITSEHVFQLRDDEIVVNFSEAETYRGFTFQTFEELRSEYQPMVFYPQNYTLADWSKMLQRFGNCIGAYTSQYAHTPCMEDREQVVDALSTLDSILQNVKPNEQLNRWLDILRDQRSRLVALKETYLGAENYDKIVAEHYTTFLAQCQQWGYFSKYLKKVRLELGEKPTLDQLSDERVRIETEVRQLDPSRTEKLNFLDTHHLGSFVFYARLTRHEVYVLYKHLARMQMLTQWMSQVSGNQPLSLNFVVNGALNVDKLTANQVQADKLYQNSGTFVEHLEMSINK